MEMHPNEMNEDVESNKNKKKEIIRKFKHRKSEIMISILYLSMKEEVQMEA